MSFSSSEHVIAIDDFHPVFLQKLADAGIRVNYQPQFNPRNDMSLLADHSILAVRSKMHFTRDVIDKLPALRCLARGGAGMDNIDEAYATSKGITLLNAPEGNRDAVAEHTLGLLLGMSKKLFLSVDEVRQGVWEREKNRGWEIGGKTIGIIGFGNTGAQFATRLSGFACRVLAYDKYAPVNPALANAVTFEELLRQSDVISLHVPLTDETRHLINPSTIASMKDGVVLLNTSRGSVCDTRAVWAGINSGKIRNFAADVLENEDIKSWNHEEKEMFRNMHAGGRVFITPHVAGWSHESYARIGEVLARKIIDYTMKVKKLRTKVD